MPKPKPGISEREAGRALSNAVFRFSKAIDAIPADESDPSGEKRVEFASSLGFQMERINNVFRKAIGKKPYQSPHGKAVNAKS